MITYVDNRRTNLRVTILGNDHLGGGELSIEYSPIKQSIDLKKSRQGSQTTQLIKSMQFESSPNILNESGNKISVKGK